MGYFKNIMVHVDGQCENLDLVTFAVDLARHHKAKLKLVDVLPQAAWPAKFISGGTDHFLDQLADTKQAHLHKLAAEFASDDVSVSCRVLQAPTSLALIREAIQGHHDLVIKATKGQESRRLGFFGTTAKRLLRKCPTPVLLVKPTFKRPFEHVVAAIDASSDFERDATLNDEIIKMAKNFCGDGAPLSLLHAWSLFGASILKEHMRAEEFDETLDKTKAHAQECLDALCAKFELGDAQDYVHLIPGDPIEAIPAFVAEQATDLLVMGTVGRSGVAGMLMGNIAEQILERVTCSVLAVKPRGFVTPVKVEH